MPKLLLVAVFVVTLSGCTIVGGGVKHTGTFLSTFGAWLQSGQAEEAVKEAAGFLPSPWREAVYGAASVFGLFGANRGRKKLVDKLKASKEGELLGNSAAKG